MDMNRTLFASATVIESSPRLEHYSVCVNMPPRIVSDGIWASSDNLTIPSEASFTMLQIQIIIIFIITQCFHFILKRVGFPYFVSQLFTGFVLGPTLKIGWLTKYKQMLFPFGSEDTIASLAVLGYAFFMFVTSVQMDFSIVTRTGKKAWAIAVLTLGIPLVIGFTIISAYKGFWLKMVDQDQIATFDMVLISHSGCSFIVISSMLSDLDILNSELGRLALSSALVSDVMFSLLTGIATILSFPQGVGKMFQSFTIYFAIIFLVPIIGRLVMRWMVRQTPEGRAVKKIYTHFIVLAAFVVGVLLSNYANLTILAGMLILGFVVLEGPPLGSELVKQFELLAVWFFLPLFVTTNAMKVDLTMAVSSSKYLLAVWFFIALVQLIKIMMCLGVCRICNMPTRDGVCLSLILISKGVVDICNFVLLYDAMKMNAEAASTMVLSAIILGSISRMGLKALYDPAKKYAGYQKRNILHLKPNSELRIVACIHKPSHIIPIKDILELCCPTPTNPLVVDVLHLMELVGRSLPIFISHRLQARVCTGYQNFSGDVIVTFNLFEHDYAGAATVNTYTAVSPQRLLQEDICNLAFDKLAQIIILPFHVRWSPEGTVDSQDENIRAINNKVLDRSPCSVAILVNKGASNDNPTKKIAMIFLGGPDDREALCLARRAIKDTAYSLYVYHLAGNNNESTNWDLLLDEEVLKSVKGYYGSVDENVTYEKISINDPSETTNFMLDIANKYDYFIVGRRNGVKSSQTAALDDWTEYSELGGIGDLLASPDTNSKASILVVQQQKMPKC